MRSFSKAVYKEASSLGREWLAVLVPQAAQSELLRMRQADMRGVVHDEQPRHIANLALIDADLTGDHLAITQTDRLAFDRFVNRHRLTAESTLDRHERADRLANKYKN